MPTRTIERNDWKHYFEQVSRSLPATEIDVEIDAPDLGAQQEVTNARLDGLSYDPRDDAFSIVTDRIEHRISHPRNIAVREEPNGLAAVEVVDSDDRKHIARLHEALKLPSQ